MAAAAAATAVLGLGGDEEDEEDIESVGWEAIWISTRMTIPLSTRRPSKNSKPSSGTLSFKSLTTQNFQLKFSRTSSTSKSRSISCKPEKAPRSSTLVTTLSKALTTW
jgi:hypothetical protein